MLRKYFHRFLPRLNLVLRAVTLLLNCLSAAAAACSCLLQLLQLLRWVSLQQLVWNRRMSPRKTKTKQDKPGVEEQPSGETKSRVILRIPFRAPKPRPILIPSHFPPKRVSSRRGVKKIIRLRQDA